MPAQSESDFMPARTSPFGFAVPFNFSISPTCSFAFGDGGTFHVEYTPHPALKGLIVKVWWQPFMSNFVKIKKKLLFIKCLY